MNAVNHAKNTNYRLIRQLNRSEYMNLFNKFHSMLVYSLTSDTKCGQCLCFNYKILGVPDTILCNPPGGAVCSGWNIGSR